MLVCSLSLKSRKSSAHDEINTSAPLTSLVHDVPYKKCPRHKTAAFTAVFSSLSNIDFFFNKLDHTSTEKPDVSLFLALFLLLGAMMLLHLESSVTLLLVDANAGHHSCTVENTYSHAHKKDSDFSWTSGLFSKTQSDQILHYSQQLLWMKKLCVNLQ